MPAALRKHESFVLEDLDSKNQTYVNERPVPPKKRRELKDGDVVRAGHTRLLFLSGRSAGGEE
jgi:pSer/pThr/pTyr-binding forkhead associated (FHA) protein